MFADELDKARLQLKETQELLYAAERAKEEQAGLKRLAENRAGQLENELAQAREDAKTSAVKLTAAVAAAAHAQVLQQDLAVALTALTKTSGQLENTKTKLAEAKKVNEKLADDLAVASQQLQINEARYVEAVQVQEAYKQRLEADLVISGSKL